MPPTPTFDQANASLGVTYDPQVQALQAQNPQIDQQLTTTLSSLDQAKVNAFKDITNSANSKGMLFSGFTPDQQATYTGTKYLPAVANARTSAQNAKNTLLDKINTINSNRQNQARGIVSAAETAAQNYTLKQQQIAASAAPSRASSSGSSGGSGGLTAAQTAAQYSVKQLTSGNYAFTGPNKAPISMYNYAQQTGNSMLDLLKNSGSAYDKAAYQDATYWLGKGGETLALSNLQKKYGKLF